MCLLARAGQKRALDPTELELGGGGEGTRGGGGGVVSHSMWVLRTKLRSSGEE